MKKIVILFSFIFFTSFSKTVGNVYVCQSKDATKYHYNPTCRGLNACKHIIVKKSIEEAKSNGLTLCGWED